MFITTQTRVGRRDRGLMAPERTRCLTAFTGYTGSGEAATQETPGARRLNLLIVAGRVPSRIQGTEPRSVRCTDRSVGLQMDNNPISCPRGSPPQLPTAPHHDKEHGQITSLLYGCSEASHASP